MFSKPSPQTQSQALFFHHNGDGLKQISKMTNYCVLKSAVLMLEDHMEKSKDELCTTNHNKPRRDFFLIYKDAAFIYTFSQLNSRAKKYRNIAKGFSQNFELNGCQVHLIKQFNLESEIQVKEGNLDKAQASTKRAENFIKAYRPSRKYSFNSRIPNLFKKLEPSS